jgi:hypothetical protein
MPTIRRLTPARSQAYHENSLTITSHQGLLSSPHSRSCLDGIACRSRRKRGHSLWLPRPTIHQFFTHINDPENPAKRIHAEIIQEKPPGYQNRPNHQKAQQKRAKPNSSQPITIETK